MGSAPHDESNAAATPAAQSPVAEKPAGGGRPARSRTPDVHEVRFISYPKLFFTWPLILAGFVFYPIAAWAGAESATPEVLGWLWISLLLLVVLTLGVDVDRNQAIFWLVLFALLVSLGLFSNARTWLQSLGVRYNQHFGLAISLVLLVPFILTMFWARINDAWRITHNEFEHYSFGKMDDSLGRGAKTIRTSFPDVFELLLGLAGTLVVFNANGQRELRRIPHVLFLPFVRRRLNKILERTAITMQYTADEEEDDDDV